MVVKYIINSTRLSKSGQRVTIVRDADQSGVVLVDNGEGVHSTLVINLSDVPPVVEGVKQIKKEWELF